MMKPIHAHINNPADSLFIEGKRKRASCYYITCNNTNNCELYLKQQCVYVNDLIPCPYGKSYLSKGYTMEALKFKRWIISQQDKYKNVLNKLSKADYKLATIGDFIFLPYSYLNSFEIEFEKSNTCCCLLHKDKFTTKVIAEMIQFKPISWFCREIIKSYQKNEVPKFIMHLKENIPSLYNKLIKEYPEIIKGYNITNIGRKAILNTLNPGVGVYYDFHGYEWRWDGVWLSGNNVEESFMFESNYVNASELLFKPKGQVIIKVTDEKQVNSNTIFID